MTLAWITTTIIGSILTLTIGALWGAATKKMKEISQTNEAIKLALQALLRAQMIADWNKYSSRGYAPIYAKDNFENVWQQYHSLGANGVMNGIHDQYMALPTEPPTEEG